jgi:hypothetical protein
MLDPKVHFLIHITHRILPLSFLAGIIIIRRSRFRHGGRRLVVVAVLRVYVHAYHKESNDVERGWPQKLIGQTCRCNVLFQ